MTPLVSAVWSCDAATAQRYPATYLFRFLRHHGLLSVGGSPAWRTTYRSRWARSPGRASQCGRWGLFLLAAGSLAVAATVIVASLVMSLLLTRGSGQRLLEQHMSGRPGYAAYVARTSGFFPRPPRS
nr:DUF1295 domain-containing protein [Streptomyces boluensis]